MKLVIFDVDGTLINSLFIILKSMEIAFEQSALSYPGSEAVKSIIGMSLPLAMKKLAPDCNPGQINDLCDGYKNAYGRLRAGGEGGALFPGMKPLVESLAQKDDVLLGIATGKTMKGTRYFLKDQGWEGYFLAVQTADDAPSKPNPLMIFNCLNKTGAEAKDTIMIGDTVFDLQMAKNAKVRSIGVSWGYHQTDHLKELATDGIAQTALQLEQIILDFITR